MKQSNKKVFNKYFEYLFLLIILTLPLKHTINSISIIAFIVFNLYWISFIFKSKFKISGPICASTIGFFIVFLQLFNSDSNVVENYLFRSSMLLILPIIVYQIKDYLNENSIENILKKYVWIVTIFSVILFIWALFRQFTMTHNVTSINWYFFTYHDYVSILNIHPTYMGMFINIAICILYKRIFSGAKGGYLNLVILFFTIFLIGSRIALFILLVLTILFLIIYLTRTNKKSRLIIALLFISGPIFVFRFIPIVKERMIDMTLGVKKEYEYAKYGENISYTGSISPRLQMWKCAIEITSNSIWFGNGYGFTQKKLENCYREKRFSFAGEDYNTHSQFMGYLARSGLIGLSLFIVMIFTLLRVGILNKDSLYVGFILITIFSCITENIFDRHSGIILFASLNALFLVRQNKLCNNEQYN